MKTLLFLFMIANPLFVSLIAESMLPLPFHFPIFEDTNRQPFDYEILSEKIFQAEQKIAELKADFLIKKGELREQAEISLVFWELNLKTWTDELRKNLDPKYCIYGADENTTIDIDFVVLG